MTLPSAAPPRQRRTRFGILQHRPHRHELLSEPPRRLRCRRLGVRGGGKGVLLLPRHAKPCRHVLGRGDACGRCAGEAGGRGGSRCCGRKACRRACPAGQLPVAQPRCDHRRAHPWAAGSPVRFGCAPHAGWPAGRTSAPAACGSGVGGGCSSGSRDGPPAAGVGAQTPGRPPVVRAGPAVPTAPADHGVGAHRLHTARDADAEEAGPDGGRHLRNGLQAWCTGVHRKAAAG